MRFSRLLTAALFAATVAAADSTQVTKPPVEPLAIGQPAPEFTLRSHEGLKVGLKEHLGRWVVLYFYPRDFTGGCTLEAQNFQRDFEAYEKAGAVILGVSVDAVGSHKKFCEQEGLRFKLLADTTGGVSAAYGSLRNLLGVKLSARNTFLIDPRGNIARIFRKVKPAGHSEEVLAALSELQKKQ